MRISIEGLQNENSQKEQILIIERILDLGLLDFALHRDWMATELIHITQSKYGRLLQFNDFNCLPEIIKYTKDNYVQNSRLWSLIGLYLSNVDQLPDFSSANWILLQLKVFVDNSNNILERK
jgi:hypothetical protein